MKSLEELFDTLRSIPFEELRDNIDLEKIMEVIKTKSPDMFSRFHHLVLINGEFAK